MSHERRCDEKLEGGYGGVGKGHSLRVLLSALASPLPPFPIWPAAPLTRAAQLQLETLHHPVRQTMVERLRYCRSHRLLGVLYLDHPACRAAGLFYCIQASGLTSVSCPLALFYTTSTFLLPRLRLPGGVRVACPVLRNRSPPHLCFVMALLALICLQTLVPLKK